MERWFFVWTPITRVKRRLLDRQTAKQVERIKRAVNALPAGDVKRLKGIMDGYRLRVGSVRVLFEKEGNSIHVIKKDNRGDVHNS